MTYTLFITGDNGNGHVMSMDFKCLEDIIIRPSMFAPDVVFTIQEEYEEKEWGEPTIPFPRNMHVLGEIDYTDKTPF